MKTESTEQKTILRNLYHKGNKESEIGNHESGIVNRES